VSTVGVLREVPLHAARKMALAQPGERFEVPVGRFVIDPPSRLPNPISALSAMFRF
jgi:hypothetical protein